MKDYERYVIWLDYFNSELKRSQGRRVPMSLATRAPKLEELDEACKKLNLQPAPQAARRPNLGGRESGYVSIKKEKPKHAQIMKIAKELSVVRGQAQKRQNQTSANPKTRE